MCSQEESCDKLFFYIIAKCLKVKTYFVWGRKPSYKLNEGKIRDLLIKLDFLDTFSQCKNNCGNIKGFLWSIILVLVSIYNHNHLRIGNNPQ